MNIWVIKRDGTISDATESLTYEVNTDIITTEKTNFVITDETLEFSRGDFVMAKDPGGGPCGFFGVIDSYENKKMICNDILTLLNFEFPATRMTGTSFEVHARNLINRYLVQDANKLMGILDIKVLTNTKCNYQPVDPPTPTNLMKYLINGFKKYNVVWEFVKFENGRIYTTISAVSDSMQFKDNIESFTDWDVSTTEVGQGIENHIMIVNKNTTNSEGPNILAEYWLTTDNVVVSDVNNKYISKPTRSMVWIYDTQAQDKPDYIDVAESELKGSFYAHEIIITSLLRNQMIDITGLRIGTLATIIYKDRTYQSVLTGHMISSENELMELRFGHIRSRLSELLQ